MEKIVGTTSGFNLRFPFEPSSSALRSSSERSGSKWTEHNRVSLITARPTRDIFASYSFKKETSVGKRWKLIPCPLLTNRESFKLPTAQQYTIMAIYVFIYLFLYLIIHKSFPSLWMCMWNRGNDQYKRTQSKQWLLSKMDNFIYIRKLTQYRKVSARKLPVAKGTWRSL